MPSAPLPETSDEVLEVFTGESLEEAMAYAVASLGPDLVVRRARKVRRGVQGLRGKETYEVAAVPAPRVASEDALEDAFASLLEEAESQEQGTPAPPVRREPEPARPAPATAAAPEPTAAAAPPAPAPAPAPPIAPPAPRAVEPAAPAAAPPAASPAASHAELERRTAQQPAVPAPATQAPARTASAPARRRTTAPRPVAASPVAAQEETNGWSRASLAALGLPRRVLDALPPRDPRSDLAWLGALERAFASVLPEPGTSATVVCGHGVEGVLGILEAAGHGMTPGTITDHGRTAPASPLELALVVRAALVG